MHTTENLTASSNASTAAAATPSSDVSFSHTLHHTHQRSTLPHTSETLSQGTTFSPYCGEYLTRQRSPSPIERSPQARTPKKKILQRCAGESFYQERYSDFCADCGVDVFRFCHEHWCKFFK